MNPITITIESMPTTINFDGRELQGDSSIDRKATGQYVSDRIGEMPALLVQE